MLISGPSPLEPSESRRLPVPSGPCGGSARAQDDITQAFHTNLERRGDVAARLVNRHTALVWTKLQPCWRASPSIAQHRRVHASPFLLPSTGVLCRSDSCMKCTIWQRRRFYGSALLCAQACAMLETLSQCLPRLPCGHGVCYLLPSR